MVDRIRWRKYQTNTERSQEQEAKNELNTKKRIFEYQLRTGYWSVPDQAFWSKWQKNKEAMKRFGFEVTKFDGRYYVHQPHQELEEKPEPKPKVVAARKRKRPSVFIPHLMSKGSLCLDCSHLDIIPRIAKHRACSECGSGAVDEGII